MINWHQAKYFIRHFFTARRNGHGIHSPFGFELCEEVFYNRNAFYDFEFLNQVRKQLLSDERSIELHDLGAGSKTFRSNTRAIQHIAKRGISTQKQSELLYRLINFLQCNNCLELGTSLGLNTLYMARACRRGSVTTIEGSRSLATLAANLAAKEQANNVRFINASFDEALPELLEENTPFDFVYIDGNHTYKATLNYFNLLLQKKQRRTVLVFDDIYWSPGMTRAWKEIKRSPAVKLSIDAFYFGLVFFREEIKEKTDLKIYL